MDSQLQFWVLVGGGVLVLLLLVILFVSLRKRQKRRSAESDDLDNLFRAYSPVFPSFENIINAFQQNHSLDELLQQEEAREAVGVLQQERRRFLRKKGSRVRKNDLLELNDSNLRSQMAIGRVAPAVVTVVRTIYFHEDFRKDLPRQADVELDRLLQSLTG